MSDRMEDLMRTTLESRAVDAGHPSFDVDDLVRRGESARRRRQLGAVGATAVAAVVVILISVVVGRWTTAPDPVRPAPPASSSAPSTSSAPGQGAAVDLAVVDGHHLRTASRDITVPLNLTATSAEVTEVKGGWVSLPRAGRGATGTATLSFIGPSGAVATLATGVDFYVVDTTGTRIAFTSRGGVTVGTLRDGRLTGLYPTPSAHGARPLTFSGNHVVMIVDGSCCGGDNQKYVPPRFATWEYEAGGFTPRWTTTPAAVYGPVLGGTRLLGMVRSSTVEEEAGCLALLRPDDLSVESRRCDLGLSWGSSYGTLSPSGRYFFDLVDQEDGALFMLGADLGAVRRTEVVPTPDQPPVWDDDTAVASVDGTLSLWRAGQAPETIPQFASLRYLVRRPFLRG